MDSVSSLVRLHELVPAPEIPVRGWGDWKRFTSVNGFPPPDDYRMLVTKYGAGSFAGWIDLIEPFHPSWTFMDKAEVECGALRDAKRRAPSVFPNWPIWPEAGGLLPWAITGRGDHIGWRTVGRPREWTVLFWDRAGDGSCEYPVGAVDFLLNVVESSSDQKRFLPAPEKV